MPEVGALISELEQGRDLEAWDAEELMDYLIGGTAPEEEILTILNAMCDKGPSEGEIVAFARVMRSKASMLQHKIPRLVDTCGTGGGPATFNISTAAAFVAAGAGATIAKHGNRSSTGLGSADLLEALGVPLGGSNEILVSQLETVGIAFLFAPAHHPAMKHVAAARKKLGRRSVFNLLGPLANPAGATRQSIGIYDPKMMPLMGAAARSLNLDRAVLSHSREGLDEISPCTETDAVVLADGRLTELVLQPEDFDVNRLEFDAIKAGTNLEEAKAMFLESISDVGSKRASAVVPSAAVAIWLAELEPDFRSAAARARASIAEGRAEDKLRQLTEAGVAV
jgi:anthranilate phosphoribosyltransferase